MAARCAGDDVILLVMTAYFSAMLQNPLTAFVVVMEMTDSHEILIPLMATSFLANWVSKLIHPAPLYRALCDSFTNEMQLRAIGFKQPECINQTENKASG